MNLYVLFAIFWFIFTYFLFFHIDIVYECIVLRCIVEINLLTYSGRSYSTGSSIGSESYDSRERRGYNPPHDHQGGRRPRTPPADDDYQRGHSRYYGRTDRHQRTVSSRRRHRPTPTDCIVAATTWRKKKVAAEVAAEGTAEAFAKNPIFITRMREIVGHATRAVIASLSLGRHGRSISDDDDDYDMFQQTAESQKMNGRDGNKAKM